MLFQKMPGQMREDGREIEVTSQTLSIMSTYENITAPSQIYISCLSIPPPVFCCFFLGMCMNLFNYFLNEKHIFICFLTLALLFPTVTHQFS